METWKCLSLVSTGSSNQLKLNVILRNEQTRAAGWVNTLNTPTDKPLYSRQLWFEFSYHSDVLAHDFLENSSDKQSEIFIYLCFEEVTHAVFI